jgi:uncharacterized membrane protein YccC
MILLGEGEDPIGAKAVRCYPSAVIRCLFTVVILPIGVGASYYFGGPVVGSLWTCSILLTCLVAFLALFHART